jgi:uncharacterized protein YegP (UPF0339 family)
MPAEFVLKKNAKGQYHFVLKAANGETIAQSESYTSKSAAKKRHRVREAQRREGNHSGRHRRVGA